MPLMLPVQVLVPVASGNKVVRVAHMNFKITLWEYGSYVLWLNDSTLSPCKHPILKNMEIRLRDRVIEGEAGEG